jgi:hypothetical protein
MNSTAWILVLTLSSGMQPFHPNYTVVKPQSSRADCLAAKKFAETDQNTIKAECKKGQL